MIAQDIKTVFAIAATLAISACGAPITYQTSLELARQDTQVERDAVDATARAFFGGDIPEEGDGGLLDGEDAFSSDTFERRQSNALAMRVKARAPLRGKLSVVGDVAVSTGRGTYDLPDGTEVLTDPAVVKVSSRALNTSIGLAHITHHGKGFSSEFSTGVGLGIAHTDTSINSALLDVSESSTDGSRYAFIGGTLNYVPPKSSSGVDVVFIDGQVKRYSAGAYDVRVAFGVGVQH